MREKDDVDVIDISYGVMAKEMVKHLWNLRSVTWVHGQSKPMIIVP